MQNNIDVPITEQEPQSGSVFTSILDLSEGKIEIKEWFANFVESLNEGFAIVDSKYCIVNVNRKFCELLGRKKTDIEGEKIESFLDQVNRNVLLNQKKKRKKGFSDPYELSWQNDVHIRHTRVSPTPLFDNSGKFLGTFAVLTDITQEKEKEINLAKAHAELEQLVLERTAEISRKNIALQELLGQIELEKKQYANRVTSNVETIVLPMIKSAKGLCHPFEKKVLDALEKQLLKLTSPLGSNLSSAKLELTPREIQICNLIRNGFTGKEISELLHVSPGTVDVHRNKIRKKMGLISSKKNLAIELRSL